MGEVEKDIAKRLTTYADAVTAVAFAQAIAFGYTIGGDSKLAANILKVPPGYLIAGILAVHVVYLCAVVFCQRRAATLLELRSAQPTAHQTARIISTAQIAIILVVAAVSVIAVLVQPPTRMALLRLAG